MAGHRSPPPHDDTPQPPHEEAQHLARVFSDIELLAAADVIRAALSEGRKHVDRDSLSSVLTKLNAAYELRKRSAR
ncbi:MAG: hypothetical protein JO158_00510 [Gammaproteobacteria bacterium]|nr:hypothetical protein [Gammaproteobacteria bacterium]MBV9723986.1 hypothetical protein [Gammaproteobacteria bacterium]